MKNVRVDMPGQLLTRGGFDTLNATTGLGICGFHWKRGVPGGATRNYCYLISTAVIRQYDIGLATHTDTSTASPPFSGAAVELGSRMIFARPAAELLVDTAPPTYTAVTSSPRTYFLTLSGIEHRVVAAYSAIAATPISSRVHFSAPGSYSTWGANDWVDLWPNDGQQIRAAVTFRDSVFVFKDRRFAVFYGESVAGDGNPIFNYRPIDVGIGCNYDFGAAVGPDGVYFIATDGIYRTQGDAPVLVSGPLQALFDSATASDYTGPTSISTPRLFATPDRLYFINDSQVFYYHFATGAWALDNYPPGVQFMAQTPTQKPRSFYFLDGMGKACEAGDSFTDDDGTAIAWSYTSAATDLDLPGRVKITRESKITGHGSVALQVANDYGAFDTGSTVVLGTAPAVADGWQQIDREGTLWQFKMSGSGRVRVDRLVHYLAHVKPEGVE